MTRTDVMASSRPRTAGVAKCSDRSSGITRRLSIIPAALLLTAALALPSSAFAAEGTSGYNQTPNTPSTSTTTPTTPSTGTSPSKETTTPTTASKETSPTTAASTPTSTEKAKATSLPFTGFDLRWSIGFGLLLMGAGFSIVLVQRRQSRDGR